MTHFQWRRRAMVVSPYVFTLEREVEFSPNYEVAEVIWVPLAFLLFCMPACPTNALELCLASQTYPRQMDLIESILQSRF